MEILPYIITVKGIPKAKQRPRYDSRHHRFYTPNRTGRWEKRIRKEAVQIIQKPLEGPIHLIITFIFPRPRSKLYKRKPMPREWKPTRPDIDNLEKAVMDALNGIAFKDDSQVVWKDTQKVMACGDEPAGVRIQIRELKEYEKEVEI